jgi:hypothetical protein
MDVIEAADRDPPVRIDPPSLDAARPCRCAACGSAAGARRLFHGHGTRDRTAVLPGRHWQGPARIVVVVARRFVCTECGTTITVLPRGILPRHLYSLFAIVHAWWLATAAPLGCGLDDRAVCARQGVDRLPMATERHRTGRRRWSSLARWATKIGVWWPTVAVAGTTWRARVATLLIAFVAGAGEALAAGIVGRAVRRHAGDGAAM